MQSGKGWKGKGVNSANSTGGGGGGGGGGGIGNFTGREIFYLVREPEEWF